MALTTNVEMLSHSTQETVPIEYISANESKSLNCLGCSCALQYTAGTRIMALTASVLPQVAHLNKLLF